jgi:ferredoxin
VNVGDRVVIEGLEDLIRALSERGFVVVGPRVRDGAIVYDEIRTAAELPVGWSEEQQAGRYRLRRRNDDAVFGYALGPHSWKRFLHPPVLRLWSARRRDGRWEMADGSDPAPRYAFLGVRACELAAIAAQDRVFLGGPVEDPSYRARRESAFLVAANCGQAGGTCFCASLGTGPRVAHGFDLALTELLSADRHAFLLEAGSDRGAELAAQLPFRSASRGELDAAASIPEQVARSMGRSLDTHGLAEALEQNAEHPRWEEVARRCLGCANCTLVCPTCFCSSVEDVSDLAGSEASRVRRWDSCFGLEFSYIHGGSVRTSLAARYRHWLTHKLSSWHDQFGSSGCVGCGRCITWCPAAIDITEEATALRVKRPERGGP